MTDIPHDDLLEVATACRILHMEGHADMTLGHLSLRDPSGRGVWIKRSGIGLGEVVGPEDFVLIDFEGHRLAGEGRIHKEWPIHTEVLRARSDVRCVGHSHPFFATSFSALDVELQAVTNEAANLGLPVGRFEETTGLIDTPALGASLARSLGPQSTVLMRNHGVLFVGGSIAEAALMGIFLEGACRAQMQLLATRLPYKTTPTSELKAKKDQILDPMLIDTFWSFYKRKVAG
ncbi:class II aldolase/adducin family protein [Labrys sp. LIt4]|uniref:class II aldolase/adducin family protein n=1 Tax=Labrys sp. LIt4 TaxID=2821355 RepID=UPI001ADFE9E3|nr:class II aldolase/adducin family protein [Labrys sp. LIt4]MBP0583359.1 class II aldolase/adducin family protein [Labrys sp. LIt4]